MNTMIEKCREIAFQAHAGQVRKLGDDFGKPYIVHPERIASNFDDPYLVCVAWLHDVVEDTPMNFEDLKKLGVPAEVIMGIDGMTRREGETYLDFILRVKDNQFAMPVKIADIKDNMVSLKEGSLKDKYRLALYILEGCG